MCGQIVRHVWANYSFSSDRAEWVKASPRLAGNTPPCASTILSVGKVFVYGHSPPGMGTVKVEYTFVFGPHIAHMWYKHG